MREARRTGRLFDEDDWLRAALGNQPPAFATHRRAACPLGNHRLDGYDSVERCRVRREFRPRKAEMAGYGRLLCWRASPTLAMLNAIRASARGRSKFI